ncbi:hypothetical protein WJX72_008262 [[Myrmecia] bisecta]|uniref:Uncharacterized protein n=1 Tax=[Myrmecia] bisecta TaxID=41462 RepID=A0AAW1R8F5_9CHLO
MYDQRCSVGCLSSQGGWTPVTLPDPAVNVTDLAGRAAGLYLGTHQNTTECLNGNVPHLVADVHTACRQVVAGTNWGLVFDAYYDCIGPDNSTLNGSFPLQAVVFVPLKPLTESYTPEKRPKVTFVEPSA